MQESIDPTRLGANRTGMQMSPMHGKEMLEGMDTTAPEADGQALAEARLDAIREAGVLGTVPAPATLKGVAKSGAAMLSGDRLQVFVDKLSERLAFERGGTRLYDGVLAKFEAHPGELDEVALEDVRDIRDEEASHALMIQECIFALGCDPTAQTPSADLVGVETMGLIQAVSDPRTTLAQTLHAALAAELADHAGWETLILLAESIGQDDMAARFREALQRENEHVQKVRSWHNALTLETSELM